MPASPLKSVTGTSYCTAIRAVAPSALTMAGATWDTCSTPASCCCAASRSAGSTVPESAWTTTRASAPENAGNFSRSMS